MVGEPLAERDEIEKALKAMEKHVGKAIIKLKKARSKSSTAKAAPPKKAELSEEITLQAREALRAYMLSEVCKVSDGKDVPEEQISVVFKAFDTNGETNLNWQSCKPVGPECPYGWEKVETALQGGFNDLGPLATAVTMDDCRKAVASTRVGGVCGPEQKPRRPTPAVYLRMVKRAKPAERTCRGAASNLQRATSKSGIKCEAEGV